MGQVMMTQLLSTIEMLGSKSQKTKEEILFYDELLAYAGSLARYNRRAVDTECRRLEDEDFHPGTENRIAQTGE